MNSIPNSRWYRIAPRLALALTLIAGPATAATYTVNSTLHGTDANGATTTLVEAIQQANTAGGSNTIELVAATVYESNDTNFSDATSAGRTMYPAITTTILVKGNGATLNATDKNARFFYVSGSGKLILEDMSLVGGKAQGGDGGGGSGGGGGGAGLGGAIFVNGSSAALVMRRSSVSACVARGGNGGNGAVFAGAGGGGGGMGGVGATSGGGGPRSAASGNTGGDSVGGNGGANNGGFGGGGGGGIQSGNAGAGGFGAGGGGGWGNLPSWGIAGAGGFGGGGGGTVTAFSTPFAVGGAFAGRGGAYNSGGIASGGGGAGLGGAIFNYQGTVTLENVTLTGNNATGGNGSSLNSVGAGSGAGGAVFNYDGSVTLKHVTAFTNIVGTDVVGNNPGVATGGALYNYDAAGGATPTVTIYNSILANSTYNNASGVEVFNNGSGTITASGAANSSLVTTSSGLTGTVLTANPQLGLPERKNGILLLRPLTGSPVLDTGDAANSLATDAGGTARPQGAGVDIGAAEGAFALSLNLTAGMLLVSDSSADAVFAVDPATGNRTLVSKTNVIGTGPDIGNPRGIAVDVNKNIYVVNTAPVVGIVKIDPANGNRTMLSSSATGAGTGPGIFTPSGIAIRSTDGKLLVTDTGGTNGAAGSDSVLVIDPVTGNRTLLSDDVTPDGVNALTTANTIIHHSTLGILVADNTTVDTLTRVDGSTGARTIFSSSNSVPDTLNPFINPQGIAEDTDGSILLIESTTTTGANRQLQRVNKTTGARAVVANLSTNLAYAGVTAGTSGIYITKTTTPAQIQKVNGISGAVTAISGNTIGDGVLFGNNSGNIGFNIGLALIPAAQPMTNLVTSLLDDGSAGSLRKMLATANSGDTLQFTNTLSGQTIVLTGGQFTVTNAVTVDATTLSNGLTIDGNNVSRIFEVLSGGSLTLKGVSIAHGYSADLWGGALRNSGTLTLAECTLAGNSVTNTLGGGAIANFGTLRMWDCTATNNFAGWGGVLINTGDAWATNCTFAFNSAVNNGGVSENNSGTLTLNHCTMTGNDAITGGGGALLNYLGTVSLRNTIAAGNTAGVGYDLYNFPSSTIVRVGANIVQDFVNGGSESGPAAINAAPLLAPLGNYGGKTHTMPPLIGSPAYNAAVATTVTNDQRNLSRPFGGVSDIGAVEGTFNAAIPLTNIVKQVNGSFQFALSNLNGMTFTVLAATNLAQPFNQWSVQGVTTEISPGNYQFADTSATNSVQKYYRLAAGPEALTRWATSVIGYSTSYGANPGDGWNASQALGRPDTFPRYGDFTTAWSAIFPEGTNEFIALGYSAPSPISSISMYETLAPGAAAIVSVRNANNGQWVQVWSGTAAAEPLVSRIFTVNFPRTAFPVDGVKIEQDSPSVPTWNEIDAVSIRW